MGVDVFVYPVLAFITTFFATPLLIRYLRKINLTVLDQNKKDTPLVPLSGGLAVVAGIFMSLLFFVFYRQFFSYSLGDLLDKSNPFAFIFLFAALVSILIVTLIGFLDDLVIPSDKQSSAGLQQWQKPLLTLAAAVPLMVVSAGTFFMWFPFIGRVEFGILYPLLVVPFIVVVASNMINMLAGLNGMETGMGLVYFGMLGLYAYIHDRPLASLIALVTFASLLAFFYYNKYPARILPGDSLTYLLGVLLAVIAILGNMERAVLIVSLPFVVEFFLKARSRFRAHSFGIYSNGVLHSRHGKSVYSLTHLFLRTGKFTERQIAYSFMLLEFIVSLFIWVV